MVCETPISGTCFADDTAPITETMVEMDEVAQGIGLYSRFHRVCLESSKRALIVVAIAPIEGGKGQNVFAR